MTPRRILVTGGAGFIGANLAARLAEDPAAEVVVVDNLSRGRLDSELEALARRPNVRFETGDLTSEGTWRSLGTGYDEVYHLAAVIGVKHVLARPADVIRVNALSTIHLLDWFAAGGGARLLFASTSEVYAWTQAHFGLPVPTPEDVPLALTDLQNPRSSYAGSKIFGELAVAQYATAHAEWATAVRYHNVYGPRMGHEHVIPELLARALAGEDPLKVYSADHTRAFCYVADAVDATIAAVRCDTAAGTVINVGNDREELSIGELAERLLRRANIAAAIAPQPSPHDPIRRRCPDLTRARELLGYEPQVTLDEGLDRTIAWYLPRLQAGEAPRAGSARRAAVP